MFVNYRLIVLIVAYVTVYNACDLHIQIIVGTSGIPEYELCKPETLVRYWKMCHGDNLVHQLVCVCQRHVGMHSLEQCLLLLGWGYQYLKS